MTQKTLKTGLQQATCALVAECLVRAEKTISFLKTLRRELAQVCGLPETLAETGKVRKEDFPAVAKTVLNDGAIIVNPAQADYNDIIEILEEVWS